MGKKCLYLRLYKQHDMDLISLYRNPNFAFYASLKKALHAYAAGEPLYFLPPQPVSLSDEFVKESYKLRITLDLEKDADILNMLKKAKKRYINAAVKNILRGTILGSYAYICFENDSLKLEDTKENNQMIWDAGTIPNMYVKKATKYKARKKNEKKKNSSKNIASTAVELAKPKNPIKEPEKPPVVTLENVKEPRSDQGFDFFGELSDMLSH